jgi:hypothetical protein
MKRLSATVLVSAFALIFSSQVHAAKIATVITNGTSAKLWDLDGNGSLSNAKTVDSLGNVWIGLTKFPGTSTSMYAVTQFSGGGNPSHLFAITPTGLTTLVTNFGAAQAVTFEGGNALDPTTGIVWAVRGNTGELLNIPLTPMNTPAVIVTTISAGAGQDYSGLAFDGTGQLYALGLSGGGTLYKVDKTTGVAVSMPLTGITAGMSVANGNAAISFSGTALRAVIPIDEGAPDHFVFQHAYNINTATGAVTHLGTTGRPGTGSTSISGMVAVPPVIAPVMPPLGLVVLALGLVSLGALALRRFAAQP